MKKQITLHVGTPKTGTSSIQNFLTSIRDKLLENDTSLTPLFKKRKKISPLVLANSAASNKLLLKYLDSVPQSKLIITDERLLGSSTDIPKGVLYPRSGNRIIRFCNSCKNSGIKIVLALRDPRAFLLSIHSEYVRHSNYGLNNVLTIALKFDE